MPNVKNYRVSCLMRELDTEALSRVLRFMEKKWRKSHFRVVRGKLFEKESGEGS
jgi:hypothetical protein